MKIDWSEKLSSQQL